MPSSSRKSGPVNLGRYVLFDEIASGGMAAVYFARQTGAEGFSRVVAIKRLHPQHAKDADFRAMFVDEARIASRIRHPNVVVPLDVVATESEVFLVMEYVHAEALSALAQNARKNGERVPLSITISVISQALRGLHAAHTAVDTAGQALNLIHRDVSPHNILVGADGTTRLIDFGIAKAQSKSQSTQDGQIKGKLAYMAPEQLVGGDVRASADIYAMGIVLWELLAGQRLFESEEPASLYFKVMQGQIASPRTVYSDLDPALERIVMRALRKEPSERYPSARAMAEALEAAAPAATTAHVASWVERQGGASLLRQAEIFRRVERAEIAVETQSTANTSPSSAQPAQRPVRASGFEATVASPAGAQPLLPMSAPLRHEAEYVHRPSTRLATWGAAGAFGALLVLTIGYVFVWPVVAISRASSMAATKGLEFKARTASGMPSALVFEDVEIKRTDAPAGTLKAAKMRASKGHNGAYALAFEGGELALSGTFSSVSWLEELSKDGAFARDISYDGRAEWEGPFGPGTQLGCARAKLHAVDGAIAEATLSTIRLTTPSVVYGPWSVQREQTADGVSTSFWLDPTNLRPALYCVTQAESVRCDVQVSRAPLAKLGIMLPRDYAYLSEGAMLGLTGRWVAHSNGINGMIDGTLELAPLFGLMGGGVGQLHTVMSPASARIEVVWPDASLMGNGSFNASIVTAALKWQSRQKLAVPGTLQLKLPLQDLAKTDVFFTR